MVFTFALVALVFTLGVSSQSEKIYTDPELSLYWHFWCQIIDIGDSAWKRHDNTSFYISVTPLARRASAMLTRHFSVGRVRPC